MLYVKIPAGAVVEVETVEGVSLRSLTKADQINFRTVKPINVGDVVIIASEAPVTFTVSETGRESAPAISRDCLGAGRGHSS